MPLYPSAELALDRQRGFQEGTAQRQQPFFQDQLPLVQRPPPGRRPSPAPGVEPLHPMGPLGQSPIFRVQRLQFVDVPQQVGPTPLLQSRVVVVGSVEVAHQNPAKLFSQRLVHHLPAPAPAQKAPLRGRAERPDAAVDPVLPPAGLIGVDHRAGTDALQRLAHFQPALPGNLVDGPDDGPDAQLQLMERLMERSQMPFDGPYRQPSLFPQGDNQAHQVDSQPLAAHGGPVQGFLWQPSPPAQRTHPGHECVLGHFHRDQRKFDDLTGPLHPTPGQGGMAFGAGFQSMNHSPCGFHSGPGKTLGPPFPGRPFLRRRLPPLGGWLMPRHPGPRPTPRQPGFQALDPLAQFGNGPLLFRDNRQQSFPARLSQVDFRFHSSLMPHPGHGRQCFSATLRPPAISPHQV